MLFTPKSFQHTKWWLFSVGFDGVTRTVQNGQTILVKSSKTTEDDHHFVCQKRFGVNYR